MVQLTEEMLRYTEASQQELEELILTLCRIPAPSHQEDARAAFCLDWFQKAGGKDVCIDDAKNVVCRWNAGTDKPLLIFMAHTDTVFPDLEPMEPVVESDKIYCPGVGDDTANLAVLMLSARYLLQHDIASDYEVLFVANSCEEGLGNLKGSRQLMQDYASRTAAVISFDGYMQGISNRAVGSARYKVTLRTEGGHSYGSFGNRNAIHLLASMITTLYDIKIPDGLGRTTYNVGLIEGGTSVNTIAQNASMLYEYRSDDRKGLAFMKNAFEKVVEAYRAMDIPVEVELIGERPCSGTPDPEKMRMLEETASAVIRTYGGMNPGFGAGSTDCNIPLSMDIPAICPGVVTGGKAHTREEFIDRDSLGPGLKVGLSLMLSLLKM